MGYHGFPYSICASVNEQIVHGFPSEYVLRESDIISLDIGATLDGFVGDTAMTVPVGEIGEELEQLIEGHQRNASIIGIEQCVPGQARRRHRFRGAVSTRKDSVTASSAITAGHGIGRKMHEAPQIPNYGRPGTKEKIRAGYCFAIEPMINIGTHETRVLDDKWTVVTLDGLPSAHFEHTVAVTEEGPEILTLTPEQKAQLKKSAVSA